MSAVRRREHLRNLHVCDLRVERPLLCLGASSLAKPALLRHGCCELSFCRYFFPFLTMIFLLLLAGLIYFLYIDPPHCVKRAQDALHCLDGAENGEAMYLGVVKKKRFLFSRVTHDPRLTQSTQSSHSGWYR